MTMNTAERFVRSMHFQPVDQVPLWEDGPFEQTLDRWYREGMPRDTHLIKGAWTYYGSEFFGLDRNGYLDVNLGMVPEFDVEVLEENERYDVIRDSIGRVKRRLKNEIVRGFSVNMDQRLGWPVKCRQDWEALKWRYNPDSPARYPQWWEEEVRCLRGRDYPLHMPIVTDSMLNSLYGPLRNWMGTENACTVFYDDPAWAHEMMDFIADFLIAATKRALEDVELDCFLWFEDYAYKAGPLLSPKIMKEFLLPRYRRVNDWVRSHGVDVIFLDTDGDPSLIIPLLLEAGVNGIYPNESQAGVDVVKLRKEYGHDLLLLGGVDKRVLEQDKKAIEKELLYKLPPLLEDGGFIPTLDHLVTWDASYENWLYYLDLKRKIVEGRY